MRGDVAASPRPPHEVQDGRSRASTAPASGRASAEAQTSPVRKRSAGSAQYSSSGRTEYSTVKQKFENERRETGRRAGGQAPQADPFLEPEKDFSSSRASMG